MAPTYLALGDSMSIDDYTGVEGGGAVARFHRWLADGWRLVDRTFDGCRMPEVPRGERGDLITLTIGGNDLLARFGWLLMLNSGEIPAVQRSWLREGLEELAAEHRALLEAIRRENPEAPFIVGTIYRPQTALSGELETLLDEANAAIAANVEHVGGALADIRRAFHGREADLLCQEIEPNLEGAQVIADVFRTAYRDGDSDAPPR